MDSQIKEILSGKPAEFKNGVHTILLDLLVKHHFDTQANLTEQMIFEKLNIIA